MPKNTKSIKETDRSKGWLKKPKTSKYIKQIEMARAILIVCEGQTEARYFSSFRVLGLTVKIIDTEGLSKLKLVERAQKEKLKTKYDEVWCVFDMDIDKGGKEKSFFDNAIEKAYSLKYKVAYSNDSFELWLCLHYDYFSQRARRDFYNKKLSEYLGFNYEKDGKKIENCRRIYSILENDPKASQKSAMDRAEKLHNELKGESYSNQNPLTLVYLLVKELNDNLRR